MKIFLVQVDEHTCPCRQHTHPLPCNEYIKQDILSPYSGVAYRVLRCAIYRLLCIVKFYAQICPLSAHVQYHCTNRNVVLFFQYNLQYTKIIGIFSIISLTFLDIFCIFIFVHGDYGVKVA